MDLGTITPLILTYNEEANIGRSLQKLTWADRIVVVDSYSTDATLNILAEYPQVEVFQQEFESHAQQWNHGLNKVDTEWVLALDADYILSDSFVEEIRTVSPSVDKYDVSFTYCVFGRPLRGSLYPPRPVLFRTEGASYIQDGHRQRLVQNGPSVVLQSPIYHDDRKSLRRWLRGQVRYARLEVDERFEARERTMIDRIRRTKVLAPLLTPLYCLFGKGLILDGWEGWYYTLQRTYAELLLTLYLLDRKLRENLDSLSDPS